jgi:GH15 family glucan-1,4-alpha-glucosidase
MRDLSKRSIEIILANQHSNGGYVASPNFETYRYCWFRDGAFIAYAMDLVGEHLSAARFHSWVAALINDREDIVLRAIHKSHSGEQLNSGDILHTRYTLDGNEAGEEWPNFQLDGFGTWLWAVREHCRIIGVSIPDDWLNAMQLVAEYLTALWQSPCYDCWEEFQDHIHSYTLAAIYAGLQAHFELSGIDHQNTMQGIQEFLHDCCVRDGHFIKFVGSEEIDASLLGLAIPYHLVNPLDPIMRQTVEKIEVDLRREGGLHRYMNDTYYGGGEWVLLTAWLGWYYFEIGEFRKGEELVAWVEAQADVEGNLPEQVSKTLNAPRYLEPWRAKWGEIAQPLLWSHAQYLITKQSRT